MMRDDMTSLSFWTGQHKDEQEDNLHSVWRDEQDWNGGFLPRTIKCERIFQGLDREYANVLRKSLEANEDIGRSGSQHRVGPGLRRESREPGRESSASGAHHLLMGFLGTPGPSRAGLSETSRIS